MHWLDTIAHTNWRATSIALVVAVGGGALWFLAAPSFDMWPLAWVAAAPLCWLVDRAPTAKRARRYAWLVGTVCSGGGFYWIAPLLSRYSSFPRPLAVLGLVLFSAYQGLVFWCFAVATRRIRDVSRLRLGSPLPMALVAPVVFVALETLWPLVFPFSLAITQAWQPLVIQIAEITGPAGVTALLFCVGGALYDTASETRLRRRLMSPLVAATMVAATLVFGYIRIAQIETERAAAPTMHVGLVQSNVPFDGPRVAEAGFASQRLAQLQDETARLQRQGAQLVIWPESAFPYMLDRPPLPSTAESDLSHHPKDHHLRSAPSFSVPLIFEALTAAAHDEPDRPPFNTAMLLENNTIVARYDKNHLVMFSEHIPFADTLPFLRDNLPRGSGHFTPGTDVATFPLIVGGATYRLAPVICLEDTLPAVSRGLSEHHPHLLVNLTNDTWFGDTSEPHQHLALAIFRAIEMRTDLVRAVNTGPTAMIDATGRIHLRTAVLDPASQPSPPTSHLTTVQLISGGHSPFARFGNLFAILCAIATFTGWIAWPRLAGARQQNDLTLG